MDCSRSKNLLSEYADGALDTETRADLERHLSSCSECRNELSALQALLDDLESLSPVAPPSDFLRQVHKRLDRPSRLSQLVGKLFFPLRFKLPLQLAGAVLTAFLIFSVITVQRQPYKVAEAPRVPEAGKSREKRRALTVDKAAAPAERPAGESIGLKTEEPLIELTLIFGKRASAMRSAAPPTAPSFESESADRESLNDGIQAPPANPTEKGRDMGDPVKKAVTASHGRILSVEPEKGDGQPAVILAEIPSDKLPFLVEELRHLGKVRLPRPLPADEVQGPVKIRIRMVPEV